MSEKVTCDLIERVTCDQLAAPHTPDRDCINPRLVGDRSIRTFETGASRDTDVGKLDYEGFISPRVLRRYAEYMQGHTKMADGSQRASDNWQKGIPRDAYMKSLARHFMELWEKHRTQDVYDQETLCAILFNAMGLLHEELK